MGQFNTPSPTTAQHSLLVEKLSSLKLFGILIPMEDIKKDIRESLSDWGALENDFALKLDAAQKEVARCERVLKQLAKARNWGERKLAELK